MLIVNARKGPSHIHGLGLIAQKFIPVGTRIWEFRAGFDVVFTEDQIQELPPAAQEQMMYYTYYDHRNQTYVLPCDDDRFVNHSDNPNMVLDLEGMFAVAIRDIQSGEEITVDYRPLCKSEFEAVIKR